MFNNRYEQQKLPVVKLRCYSCGHIWIPRNEELPICCPRCKTYNWREDRIKDEFQRELQGVD